MDWTLDEAGRLVAVDEVEHRLAIQQSNGRFTFLGSKGTGPGEFHYPKCVEILNGTAYVVDLLESPRSAVPVAGMKFHRCIQWHRRGVWFLLLSEFARYR